MLRALRALDRAVGLVIDGFGLLAGAVLAAITLSISAEVIVRAFGGAPFGWTLEMAEYGLLVIGFLGSPWVLRHGDHIRVDVVLRGASPTWRGRLLILSNALAGATCAILAFHGVRAAWEAFASGAILFKQVPMPQWIVLSAMPLGTALLAFEFAGRALRRLAGATVEGDGLGGPAL